MSDLRFDEAERRGPHETIDCVHCGFDYLHITEAEISHTPDGKSTIRVNASNGLRVIPQSSQFGLGRGVAVTVFMQCESCRNVTALSLAFHKGQTLEYMYSAVVDDDFPSVPTIWRD